MCAKLVKMWHKTYEWLHRLCQLFEMTVHFKIVSSEVVQSGAFYLASGEKCSSQLRPCDIKKKMLLFFGFGFFFL